MWQTGKARGVITLQGLGQIRAINTTSITVSLSTRETNFFRKKKVEFLDKVNSAGREERCRILYKIEAYSVCSGAT